MCFSCPFLFSMKTIALWLLHECQINFFLLCSFSFVVVVTLLLRLCIQAMIINSMYDNNQPHLKQTYSVAINYVYMLCVNIWYSTVYFLILVAVPAMNYILFIIIRLLSLQMSHLIYVNLRYVSWYKQYNWNCLGRPKCHVTGFVWIRWTRWTRSVWLHPSERKALFLCDLIDMNMCTKDAFYVTSFVRTCTWKARLCDLIHSNLYMKDAFYVTWFIWWYVRVHERRSLFFFQSSQLRRVQK